MDDLFFKKLIKKYNNGTATDAERFILDTWYNSFEEDLMEIPGTASAQESETTRSRIFNKIVPEPAVRQIWYRKTWLQIAAALLIISGFYVAYSGSQEPKPAAATVNVANVLYQTGQREIKKIMLKDSTVIWLNANSSISLPRTFGSKERRLHLTGEANFEVHRDTLRPFIVDAREIRVRVLGTAFNVKAYPKLDEIKVSVSRGKVQVNEGGHTLALLTKEKGLVYHKLSKEFKVGKVLSSSSTAWIEGRIILEKASYLELQQAVFNLYGLNLNTKDKKVMSFRYNLSLRSSQSEKDALQTLMTILNKKIKREGSNEISIY